MAESGQQGAEVKARIVYWGIEGSGKSANVREIHSKLRPDNRGEFRTVPTRLDPTVTYDALPIELGQIGGVRTRILIIAVPGPAEHAPTRKQLLDQVDGIVFERMLFCNLWGGETLPLEEGLQEMEIPLLVLDREYIPGAVGQLRTRLQAFIEMIKGV